MSKTRRSAEFKNQSRVIDMDEARAQRQAKREAQARKKKRQRVSKTDESRGKRAIRRKKKRMRMMEALFVLIILIVLVIAAVQVVSLISEKKQAEERHEALLKQKAELEKELENSGDKQAIEDEARKELRFIKPGEVLYMFPSDFNEDNSGDEE